jgi:predicted nucleic acid-binding protein
MVAAVSIWHEHHEPAAREINKRLSRGETVVSAAPALVETFSVLTRFPPPHRLAAADAIRLLDANFLADDFEVVALGANDYRDLIHGAPKRSIAGGRIYDEVIIACAIAGKVDVILTFNEDHFRPIAPGGVEIVVPT